MSSPASFAEVLDATDRLELEEQEELVEIVRRRIIDQRRLELASEIREARAEYGAGHAKPISPSDLIDEILS